MHRPSYSARSARLASYPFLLSGRRRCLAALPVWCLRAGAVAFWRFKISTGLLIVAAIGAVTLFIALTTVPNNWDSQTYHLPRVEHWIQDRSLAFYPTSIMRQNELGPVAEILLLQTRILGGSDVFYPLVQWISMVCAVAAVFRITRQLGGDEPGAPRRYPPPARNTVDQRQLRRQANGRQCFSPRR